MNDIVPTVVELSACFLKIATGIALLIFARAALVATRKNAPETIVSTTSTTATSGSEWSNKVISVTYKPEPEQKPAPAPEQVETIECGNCHNDIKSAPIKQVMDPSNPHEIYQCEHCGKQVSVSL